MRALILVAGAALTLSACSGGGEAEDNGIDTLEVNNLVLEGEGTGMGMDTMNGTTAIDPATGQPMTGNAMTGNAMDPATQNAMAADMNTNDPDTNLANGL